MNVQTTEEKILPLVDRLNDARLEALLDPDRRGPLVLLLGEAMDRIEKLQDAGLEAQANEARAVEAAERLRAVLEEIKQTSEPGRGAYILASRALLF